MNWAWPFEKSITREKRNWDTFDAFPYDPLAAPITVPNHPRPWFCRIWKKGAFGGMSVSVLDLPPLRGFWIESKMVSLMSRWNHLNATAPTTSTLSTITTRCSKKKPVSKHWRGERKIPSPFPYINLSPCKRGKRQNGHCGNPTGGIYDETQDISRRFRLTQMK